MIKSDYELWQEAKSIAESIMAEYDDDDDRQDAIHEYADQSQHVIYTARAIAICGNCNTDDGESYLEDIYEKPFDGCETFEEVCTRLAYATLYCAINDALRELIDEQEESQE